jgi:hypothetical protein
MELEAAGVKPGRGYCHQVWRVKKRILKDVYGITWKSLYDLTGWRID